jgi:hypothetical protein
MWYFFINYVLQLLSEIQGSGSRNRFSSVNFVFCAVDQRIVYFTPTVWIWIVSQDPMLKTSLSVPPFFLFLLDSLWGKQPCSSTYVCRVMLPCHKSKATWATDQGLIPLRPWESEPLENFTSWLFQVSATVTYLHV